MGLAYCSRSWSRWDFDISELRKYDEAHRWGTLGGRRGIADEHVRISSSSCKVGFACWEGKFDLVFLGEDDDA